MAFIIERYSGASLIASITLKDPSFSMPTRVSRRQPRALSAGGSIYTYTQGLTEQRQTYSFKNLSDAKVEELLSFIKYALNGSANVCKFLDPLTGKTVEVYLENPEDVYEMVRDDRSEIELVFRLSTDLSKSGWSLSCDGVDDLVSVPHAAALDPGSSDFSVEISFMADVAARAAKLIWKDTVVPPPPPANDIVGYHIGINLTGMIYGSLKDVTYSGIVNGPVILAAQKYDVALVRDTVGGKLKLYVNGGMTEITLVTGIISLSSINLSIGGRPSTSEFFDGKISRALVWNRKLSATEISEHSNGVYNSLANLAGWWKFDEGSGATLSDSSGNGNHGTISGAQWMWDWNMAT